MSKFLTLNIIIMSLFAVSFANQNLSQNLVKQEQQNSLLNEIVVYEPVEDHKFNTDSPNKCGDGRLIEASKKSISCQMLEPGPQILELFVCDKKGTYCKREEVKLEVQSPTGILGWGRYYYEKFFDVSSWSTPGKADVSYSQAAKGFIHNDLPEAIKRAKADKKPILLFMTQIYCPPCRVMKELTIESEQFQSFAKDFVKVQFDTDLDIHSDLVASVNYKYTPTFMVLTPDFKEVDRFVGALSPEMFGSWVNSLKSDGLIEIEKLKTVPKEGLRPWQAKRLFWNWTQSFEDKDDTGLSSEQLSDYAKYRELFSHPDQLTVAKFLPILRTSSCGHLENAMRRRLFLKLLGKLSKEPNFVSEFSKLWSAYDSALPREKVACAFDRFGVLPAAEYYLSENAKNSKPHNELKAELMSLLKNLPKKMKVKHSSHLDVMLADLSGDKDRKLKLYNKLRGKNKNDYTYDYWEAGDAFRESNYNLALTKIEESLTIAKDRSWQKAFKFKLKILEKMQRKAQALKALEDVLNETRLPRSKAPFVHKFIQDLRKKQVSLKEA